MIKFTQWVESTADRHAFEATIDQNPLDSTAHLVFADYLDELGEHQEAAFQRVLGEWMQKTPPRTLFKTQFMVNRHELPKGVRDTAFTVHSGQKPKSAQPYEAEATSSGYIWTTYRGMEDAFRKSFNAYAKVKRRAR